jgi:hypothetical protein
MSKIKKLINVVAIGNSTFFEDDDMKVTNSHRCTWSYTRVLKLGMVENCLVWVLSNMLKMLPKKKHNKLATKDVNFDLEVGANILPPNKKIYINKVHYRF